MPAIPFVKTLAFDYGAATDVTPLVRRVVARNPSPFTFHGTGTNIIGRGNVAVVDPGPDDPEHIDAVLRAVRGETVTHILVTHTHSDHVPAAPAIARATGAKIHAFGPHPRPPAGETPEQEGELAFAPDIRLADGDVVEGDGWTVEAVHTPGHISNHLCFAVREDKALLTGDHVMGWSTTVISPPDGNMADYFASLRKLLPRGETVYIPTHGAEIRDPIPFVKACIEHRLNREAQILARLKEGPQMIPEMVAKNYADTPKHLHAAAGRSMQAHLIQMVKDGRVETGDGRAKADSLYRLAGA
jgi:glyoxylase-like metal-dependent hydrolase (beta-lactamase superfamily II)